MSTATRIEWADMTWSPIIGCDRVSPGCDHCYAIRTARIRSANPHPKIRAAFAGTVHRRPTDDTLDWTGQVNLIEDRLTDPMAQAKPLKIFVNSLSDLFHKDVPTDYIAQVFAVMALTPRHTYQVLTKRPARMGAVLDNPAFHLAVLAWTARLQDDKHPMPTWNPGNRTLKAWPLPNVWLGVSVEDQHWANIRIPALLQTPAAVRFISAEPLLGPVDLTRVAYTAGGGTHLDVVHGRHGIPGVWTGPAMRLDWVIAGGESGPKARPPHPRWFQDLRDQCASAGVPYHFKQWGDWAQHRDVPDELRRSAWDEKRVRYVHPADGRTQGHGDWNGHDHEEGWAAMQRIGKKAAGRTLDGRTHDEFPATP